MHAAFAKNLAPWAETIAAAPSPALAEGDFRFALDGQVLRALRDARSRDRSVPAEVYERQPNTSLIAPTGVERRLPARLDRTAPCHVACLNEAPDEEAGAQDDTADGVAASDAMRHTHFLRAPAGCCPCPDPRTVSWTMPKTLTPARTVALASATNKDMALTYAARCSVRRPAWYRARSCARAPAAPSRCRSPHASWSRLCIKRFAAPLQPGQP